MDHVINVGRVSTRSGAKLHLNINGLASCGAGDGRILGPAREITAKVVDLLCRRCWRRIKALVAEAIHIVMRRRDGLRLRVLNAVSDAMRSPAEIVAEERMVADMAAGLKAKADGSKPKTLADLRNAHLAAIAADRAEFATRGQLPLCEVAA